MTLTRGNVLFSQMLQDQPSSEMKTDNEVIHTFHRYETITDLMNLQDQIDQFQKLVFANFRPSSNNECRIAALVPLVEESYAIYKFATSMLRAMYKRMSLLPTLSVYFLTVGSLKN